MSLYEKAKDLFFQRRTSNGKFEEFPLIVQPNSLLGTDSGNNLVMISTASLIVISSLSSSYVTGSESIIDNLHSVFITSSGGMAVGGYSNNILTSSVVQIGYGLSNGNNIPNAVQIGYQAGQNGVDSKEAIQIGYRAGLNSLSAQDTIQIGSEAGENSTNAGAAVQIGWNAGRYATIADGAVQIGYNAGKNSGESAGAVQIGERSGENAIKSSYAIQIGQDAGRYAQTSSYTTFIGTSVDALSPLLNVTKSIALGYNARVSASNTAVIGGTGVDAVKVTIGGTSAVNVLDVVGNISASVITASLFYGTASWALNSLGVTPGGSYNISASYASASLSSISSSYLSGSVVTNNITSSNGLIVSNGNVGINAVPTEKLTVGGNVKLYDGGNDFNISIFAGETQNVKIASNADSFLNGGKLGIGKTVPVNTLDVVGNISCSVITGSSTNGLFANANLNIVGTTLNIAATKNLTVARISIGEYGCTFLTPAINTFYNVASNGISASVAQALTTPTSSIGVFLNPKTSSFTMSFCNINTTVRSDVVSASIMVFGGY